MSRKYELSLPESVRFIIQKFNKSGYRADIVGGCVRDFLLGTTPHDYDLTTDATPEEMKQVLSGCRVIETGIKHGTLTLMLEGQPYEITTYRIDGEYADNRHPEKVTFSRKIEDDLSRRDFTMNAIAYSPDNGITDPFGGIVDIERHLIRAVGDASVRFTEDALRILRAIRFSSVLDFDIDGSTAMAAIEKRELLRNISAERILCEWRKLLSGVRADAVVRKYLPIISVFLPELASLDTSEELPFTELLDVQERGILLYVLSAGYSSEPYCAALRRLRSDNGSIIHASRALDCLADIDRAGKVPASDAELGMLLYRFGSDAASSALKILTALGKCDGSALMRLRALLSEAFPYRISDLKVNGNDLKGVGIVGRSIGRALDSLLVSVINDEVENEREALLNALSAFPTVNKDLR